jgi:hypothetical protein
MYFDILLYNGARWFLTTSAGLTADGSPPTPVGSDPVGSWFELGGNPTSMAKGKQRLAEYFKTSFHPWSFKWSRDTNFLGHDAELRRGPRGGGVSIQSDGTVKIVNISRAYGKQVRSAPDPGNDPTAVTEWETWDDVLQRWTEVDGRVFCTSCKAKDLCVRGACNTTRDACKCYLGWGGKRCEKPPAYGTVEVLFHRKTDPVDTCRRCEAIDVEVDDVRKNDTSEVASNEQKTCYTPLKPFSFSNGAKWRFGFRVGEWFELHSIEDRSEFQTHSPGKADTYYLGDKAKEMCDKSSGVYTFPRTADNVVRTGFAVDGVDVHEAPEKPSECKVIITETKYACEVSEAWVPLVNGAPQPATVDWVWVGMQFNVLQTSDSEYGIDASDPSWIEEAAQMSDDDYDAFTHAYFFAASYQSEVDTGTSSGGSFDNSCFHAYDLMSRKHVDSCGGSWSSVLSY